MDEQTGFRAWCDAYPAQDWLIATSFEESFFFGAWAAWRHLRTALAAATERAEAAERASDRLRAFCDVEAGMLREAMEAYLAMPGSVAAVAGEDELMTAAEAEEGFSVDARRERLSVLNDMHDEKKRMDAEQREAMSKFLSDPNGDDGPTVNELAWALRDVGKTLGFRANVSTRDEARRVAARIAQLEHERDEYRRLYEAEAAAGQALSETHTRATADYIAATDEADEECRHWRQTAERAQSDLDALRKTLETERQAAVATAEELESRRAVMEAAVMELPSGVIQGDERTLAERVRDLRKSREQMAEELERVRKDLADERGWNDKRRDMYERLGRALDPLREKRYSGEPARDDATEVEAACRELAALRDRYRPRRQSEEPAPDGAPIMRWNATTMRWQPSYGYELRPDHTWTHQPPAPEGGR